MKTTTAIKSAAGSTCVKNLTQGRSEAENAERNRMTANEITGDILSPS